MVAIFSALRAKKVMTSISSLHLSDIASTNVLTVSPEDSIATVISLFAEKRVSSIIVVEHGRPIGIVTERDLLRLLCAGVDEQRSVRAIMSAPLLTARENLEFSEAQLMMSSQAIRHLVLVGANGELKGVASETDFRRHLGADLFAVIQSLSAVMDQSQELIARTCRFHMPWSSWLQEDWTTSSWGGTACPSAFSPSGTFPSCSLGMWRQRR